MAEVTLTNVLKNYKLGVLKDTLRNINLDIKDGEFIVFVGPSGCGKSTLLRMVAGLEDITGGELKIDGVFMNDIPPVERGVGMVFQSYALYPHMDVRENMAFGLKLKKFDKDTIEKRVAHASKILGLEALMDRKPKALSGGQRQRVAIGRSIVQQPNVFLFDEPLSNLDAALRVKMRIEIAKLHKELNATIIYVTHDQVEAMTLADRIAVLSPLKDSAETNLEQFGSPLELYHNPCNKFVAGGIRPEHLVPVDHPDAENRLSGVVQVAEHLGAESFVYMDVDGEDFTVKAASEIPVDTGDSLEVGIPAKACYLFDHEEKAFRRTSKYNRS